MKAKAAAQAIHELRFNDSRALLLLVGQPSYAAKAYIGLLACGAPDDIRAPFYDALTDGEREVIAMGIVKCRVETTLGASRFVFSVEAH
jgi:hypothetical protein